MARVRTVAVAMAIAGSVLAGAVAIGEHERPFQDQALLQLQQQLSNLTSEMNNRSNAQKLTIDTLEREVLDLRTRVRTLEDERRRQAIAQPVSPASGSAISTGIVSAQTVETRRLALVGSSGQAFAYLHLGDTGPELLLRHAGGQVIAAVVSNPDGAELRLSDTGGNLRLRLSSSREGGEIVLLDANGNETLRLPAR